MSTRGTDDWLRQAVASCARSADAYKAAFMLAGEATAERQLLSHCKDRYALLERLLARLGELGVAPPEMRQAIGYEDTEPPYFHLASEALEAARRADRLLKGLLEGAGCYAL